MNEPFWTALHFLFIKVYNRNSSATLFSAGNQKSGLDNHKPDLQNCQIALSKIQTYNAKNSAHKRLNL